MTKLSELIRDEIDGAEECRGRDSQLSQWIRMAERLEDDRTDLLNALISVRYDISDLAGWTQVRAKLDALIAAKSKERLPL